MSARDRDLSNKGTPRSDIYTEKVGYVESNAVPPHHALRRQLKNRHIAMISIGGVIGTGLFLSSANDLSASSWGIWLLGRYATAPWSPLEKWFLIFPSLAAISSWQSASSTRRSPSYVDSRYNRVISLADSRTVETMGWNYWYNWTIVLPAELSAAAILVDFWDKDTNLNSVWITICLVVVVAINFMGAGVSP